MITNETANSEKIDTGSTIETIKVAIDGMTLRSESSTDCRLEIFAPAERINGPITAAVMHKHSRSIVQPNSWERFVKLKQVMTELLNERQVFRMSRLNQLYNVTYYVVGIDENEALVGFFVGAEET